MAKSNQKTERQLKAAIKKQMVEEARAKRETKKLQSAKIDGSISWKEIERLRNAIRQVWQWTSVSRRICIKRATGKDGFATCENIECLKRVPKVFADHIQVLGSPLAPDYLIRLYCHSKELQALCQKCHDKKTKAEREAALAEFETMDMGF